MMTPQMSIRWRKADSARRFNYVYKFLGLPYQDVQLLPPEAKSKL